MKPNKNQLITLLISLPTLSLLYYYHTKYPGIVLSAHLILLVMVVIILIIGLKTQPEINNKILWKQKALKFLERKICPFCERNQIGEYKITIGYLKNRYDVRYMVLWIEYKSWKEELVTSSPICDSCREKFLKRQLPEPSLTVLEQKGGYRRGLKNPYEKSKIFKPESSDFLSNI